MCKETFFICIFLVLLSDCQTVLVELLVAMVSQRITAEELALLIRLFLEKTPPTVNRAALISYIEGVACSHNPNPLTL